MRFRKIASDVTALTRRFLHDHVKSHNYVTRKYFCAETSPKMSEKASGKYLSEIVGSLEKFAPLSLAESWDNVGLLVNPMVNVPIQSVLLTNDLTEDVVEEAKKLSAGLIISYHPNIFQGMKRVSERTWKERVVIQCIKNNIAVFSPHTTWDCVKGGVNDWLAQSFSFSSITPVNPNLANPEFGSGRILHLNTPKKIKDIVEDVKKHIGIPHLRLALGKDRDETSTVSAVAICAGSGSSVLSGVSADLYLTGEMLHHDVLDATQKGIHVILCNHSDSERGFLRSFKDQLQRELLQNQVQVSVSQVDRDPLKTV